MNASDATTRKEIEESQKRKAKAEELIRKKEVHFGEAEQQVGMVWLGGG
jgi:hypothetical protein